MEDEFCEWVKRDGYRIILTHETSCGKLDTFDEDFKYCHYCGKKIKEVKKDDQTKNNL